MLAWVIGICGSFFLGYKLNSIEIIIRELQAQAETRRKDKSVPDSIVIDPDDVVQRTRAELEAQHKRLNPDE